MTDRLTPEREAGLTPQEVNQVAQPFLDEHRILRWAWGSLDCESRLIEAQDLNAVIRQLATLKAEIDALRAEREALRDTSPKPATVTLGGVVWTRTEHAKAVEYDFDGMYVRANQGHPMHRSLWAALEAAWASQQEEG